MQKLSVKSKACQKERSDPLNSYDDKTLRIATRRAEEHSPEFKDRYRWRSGIEATMSQYDRLTGVKRLRVRGFPAVRFCVILKAIGINLLRATSVQRALKIREETPSGGNSPLHRLILVVKEHLGKLWGRLGRLTARLTPQYYPHRLSIAV